jgi:hypothetical protein
MIIRRERPGVQSIIRLSIEVRSVRECAGNLA